MSTSNVVRFEKPENITGSREHRPRVLKGATILTSISASTASCLVRSQNAAGFGIQIDAEQKIPAHFLLYVPVDGIAYRCKLRWRKGDKAGLSFDGTEPKPKWHYG